MSEDTTSQETTEDVSSEENVILDGAETKEEPSGPEPIYKEEDPEGDSDQKEDESKDGGDEEEKSEEESEDEDDDKEEESGEEEEYDNLEKPDGSFLSDADMERILNDAKSEGLGKEAAQKRVEFASDLLNRHEDNLRDRHVELSNEWIEECKADKEIGGEKFEESVAMANKALSRFANEEFIQALKDTKYGNNPHTVKVFARIGRAMADDNAVMPGNHPGS